MKLAALVAGALLLASPIHAQAFESPVLGAIQGIQQQLYQQQMLRLQEQELQMQQQQMLSSPPGQTAAPPSTNCTTFYSAGIAQTYCH